MQTGIIYPKGQNLYLFDNFRLSLKNMKRNLQIKTPTAMKSIITLSILFACLSSFGQQYFYKKFSGTTGVGWPVNAVTDNDGNFYISLMSGLPIKDRIAKIDAAGNMLWTKQYTVESNNAYGWEEVVPAHDGGFVFIGNDLEITNPSDQAFSKKRVHFVKIANSGNVVWTKRYNMNDSVLYNGNASYWSQAYSLIKIPTGGYLASADLYHQYSGLPGSGSSNILLMRLDNDGNLLWSKTFNINENSLYKALRRPVVQLCSNGDFIVSGNSENSGNSGGNVVGEAFIARFNSNGNPLWLKRYLFPLLLMGITALKLLTEIF